MLTQGQVPRFEERRRGDGDWLLTIHDRIKREQRVIERKTAKDNVKWIFLIPKVDYNNLLVMLKPQLACLVKQVMQNEDCRIFFSSYNLGEFEANWDFNGPVSNL